MKKIIVQEMLSADGFFTGQKGDISWHIVDDEFNEYAEGILNSVDTLMFGRVTYDLMASYWPTEEGLKDNAAIANKMNGLPKIVFSQTAENLEWGNPKIFNKINKDEIISLKEGAGKDIVIYGSGMVVTELARLGLIDEYRFVVNPVVLGKGRTLFETIEQKFKLELLETKVFKSGNVLLRYRPLSETTR